MDPTGTAFDQVRGGIAADPHATPEDKANALAVVNRVEGVATHSGGIVAAGAQLLPPPWNLVVGGVATALFGGAAGQQRVRGNRLASRAQELEHGLRATVGSIEAGKLADGNGGVDWSVTGNVQDSLGVSELVRAFRKKA